MNRELTEHLRAEFDELDSQLTAWIAAAIRRRARLRRHWLELQGQKAGKLPKVVSIDSISGRDEDSAA